MSNMLKPRATQFLFFLLFIGSTSFSQDILMDSCGLDNASTLNTYEITYLEKALRDRQMERVPDLTDKNILFLSGTFGTSYYTKRDFFAKQARPYYEGEDSRYPQIQIITLTDEEKQQVKNVDYIIVTWSKLAAEGRPRKKFIRNAKMAVENQQ